MNKSGSPFAHAGSLTLWILSPVVEETPKSRFDEFSRNLEILVALKDHKFSEDVLRASKEFGYQFTYIPSDVL
jgi:hypothetical protein